MRPTVPTIPIKTSLKEIVKNQKKFSIFEFVIMIRTKFTRHKYCCKYMYFIMATGKGQNYENQNVENQKELRKLRRRSERQNDLFSWSERRKANYQNVEKRIITTSKRVDHYYENHNVEKNVESRKTTFDVVIILNAIGKIRT